MAIILSISVPDDLRAPLDTVAARQRRSRSFVVSDAVREYIARQTDAAFDEARDQTLREGIALSPPARVRLAESLAEELSFTKKKAKPYTIGFDTFTAYNAWLAKRRLVPR